MENIPVNCKLCITENSKHIKQREKHLSAAHAAFLSEHLRGRARAALNWNYRLLYLTSFFFFYSPSYKACHMFRTNCIMHFLRSSSVCVLPIDILSDVLVSNYCISILTVLLHNNVSIIKNISIYRTNSIYRPALALIKMPKAKILLYSRF